MTGYDMIWQASLMCTQKLARASLIYGVEPKTARKVKRYENYEKNTNKLMCLEETVTLLHAL